MHQVGRFQQARHIAAAAGTAGRIDLARSRESVIGIALLPAAHILEERKLVVPIVFRKRLVANDGVLGKLDPGEQVIVTARGDTGSTVGFITDDLMGEATRESVATVVYQGRLVGALDWMTAPAAALVRATRRACQRDRMVHPVDEIHARRVTPVNGA